MRWRERIPYSISPTGDGPMNVRWGLLIEGTGDLSACRMEGASSMGEESRGEERTGDERDVVSEGEGGTTYCQVTEDWTVCSVVGVRCT
jgi:hypothetical protein